MSDDLAETIASPKDLERLTTLKRPKGNPGFRTYWGDNRHIAAWRMSLAKQYLTDQFALAHPRIWEWLQGNSFGYARKMYKLVAANGTLTKVQLRKCNACITHKRKRKTRSDKKRKTRK